MGIDGKSCANAPKMISLILDHSPCHNMDLTSVYTLTFDCHLSLYNFFHRIAFRWNAGKDSRDICRRRCVRNSPLFVNLTRLLKVMLTLSARYATVLMVFITQGGA